MNSISLGHYGRKLLYPFYNSKNAGPNLQSPVLRTLKELKPQYRSSAYRNKNTTAIHNNIISMAESNRIYYYGRGTHKPELTYG